jgi:hypothetical protein
MQSMCGGELGMRLPVIPARAPAIVGCHGRAPAVASHHGQALVLADPPGRAHVEGEGGGGRRSAARTGECSGDMGAHH